MKQHPRVNPSLASLAFAVIGLLLLAGCGDRGRGDASRERVFAIDLTGAAKTCSAPSPRLTDGQTAQVPMKLVNDGGWCSVSVAQPSGRPFDSGLLIAKPARGRVYIHRVGDVTRIDYTPPAGFAGADTFAVRLIPGDASIQVNVAVTAN